MESTQKDTIEQVPAVQTSTTLPSRSEIHGTRPRPRITLPRIIRDIAIILPLFVLLMWMVFYPSTQSAQPQQAAQSQPQSARIESAFDNLEVSGRVGATPVVTLKKPVSLVGVKERVYEEGKGRIIAEGQPVLLAITAFDGNSGELLNPSGRSKLQVGYALEEHFEPELLHAVIGRAEGTRIVMIRKIKDDALAPNATSPFEIDIVDILPSIATGVVQANNNGSPLQVDVGEAGPRVSHTGKAPANLTTQLLLKGEGAQVHSGDKIVAQYIMSRWSDGVVRQSSWDRGTPELIDLSTAMPGLVQGLIDQRVGSRVALTIPPDQATGEDTMVVVVDILGAAPGTEQANQSQSR